LSRKVAPAPCELSASIQSKLGSATDALLWSTAHAQEGGSDYFVFIVDDSDVELLEEGFMYDMVARFVFYEI
jgi:hypothetical protein